ncbi:MAG: tRNA uridine-5-carboxymethylaminomethyl(34) synthesis GTPase MnmE, partial [Deltaproteobacteria bacterium]|nr:tRNA uridine-5-carboxymethylaminomethyl(34) synthesis GTPase MnmE [Deltaproteobacteria bacterium]
VLNKIDLPSRLSKQTQKDRFSDLPIIPVSALTGDGLNQLKKTIPDYVLKSDTDIISSRIIPNLRQRKAMMDACDFFRGAVINSKNDAPMEIVSLDLKSGLDTLGEIIGETCNDEILDRVFSNFCLGK